jgi:hypothetical protein
MQDLNRILWDFMKSDEAGQRAMVTSHPELLSDEVQLSLDVVLERARQDRHDDAEKLFRYTKDRLAAFRERRVPMRPDLIRLLKEHDSLVNSQDRVGAIDLLRRGLAIAGPDDPLWVRPRDLP